MGAISNEQETRFSGSRRWWQWGQHAWLIWEKGWQSSVGALWVLLIFKDGWGELRITEGLASEGKDF